LLGRKELLDKAIERWRARAIWVVSRADAEYPRRLKTRLGEDAPAVLYGCGDKALLETGGLAVVGSRHVDKALIDYTMNVGRLAARAGRTLISGGAEGIDQAAMDGALEAGGKVCGVLANRLEKTAEVSEHHNLLQDGQLVLISPYDPSAGFNVGNAMQRNKLIYALADISLVVSAKLKKGGTWAGAVEQLDKLKFVPVFVRSTGEFSAGLDELRKKGALPWPDPKDVDSFKRMFNEAMSTPTDDPQLCFSHEASSSADAKPEASLPETAPARQTESEASAPKKDAREPADPESTLDQKLFATVRAVIKELLMSKPMKEEEVAAKLDLSRPQARAWLQRLVAEGVLEKRKKPAVYIVKQESLFKQVG
jgi:predicted Rossmann fold nucleotide-binding protein DprA/Smf involved in DNA uptake